ncbi:UDP-N-acetylmuramoyl-L-alanyl-D-glutamate--2,6-diaminopimelate ligase [Arcanobacterium wilhelmae]|uniref:UDP-N-acetylmuramyl-tripeptide synthetase n=1 Tax=Arcanobacterium wilhelmae TaxID=1803177 RepID=A0ABT9N977_9ACTO|nr:UDP-N-acetylmuramoyl-L-alanyl-D-glutamate--2,6-diaminopimelate ligase [Arcanobacterium wilhelmae]MDP9800254.1 UDP-N-acetylmuramoyl-L-alanyl-D-glutamate--2,6-diaminopimelate ligase [Arcanobacterium wilhelmae]WFN89693.1 UDP-N-acetylmuramoyl-L-alanyl-D-glutamate--2,6-diaminopimelate ligase [Arcanobacterium wilhelmae]
MLRSEQTRPVSLSMLAQAVGASAPTVNVTGAVMDNRAVRPGDLFIAMPGARVHAARFAGAAVEAGAAAVLTDAEGARIAGELGVPAVVVPDVAAAAGTVAALAYGEPAKHVRSFAVTGTNGKTTTTFMIDSILRGLGAVTGLIGTVELRLASQAVPARMTTPQPDELQAMLEVLVERGGTDVVMEVSSHALAQGRTRPIRYSVAGFTNLTQDHLDFHETFEEYYAAKKTLFESENSQRCVILVDDEYGKRLFSEVSAERSGVVSLSLGGSPGTAGWRVSDVVAAEHGHSFTLTSPSGETISTSVALPAMFNVANAALAIAMAAESGVPLAELERALAGGVSPVVPGRMEVVSARPRVVVDFAHNEDALVKAMDALGSLQGRLIVVTGSAGERDTGKRPAMARVVSQRADITVITDDDPHHEDPAAIRADLIAGIVPGAQWREIGDRREAIRWAVNEAAQEDTILLAGRGHETAQNYGEYFVEIDDREVAREAVKEKNER